MSEPRDELPKLRIKSPRALAWLLIILVSLPTGVWWLWYTKTKVPFDAPPWLAVAFVGVAGIALWGARAVRWQTTRTRETAVSDNEPELVIPLPWLPNILRFGRGVAFIGTLLLTAYSLNRFPQLAQQDDYTSIIVAWTAAIALYFFAVIPRQPDLTQTSWLAKWREQPRLVWAVSGILLLAFVLRVWRVGSLPFTLSGDEASQGLESIRVLDGTLRNPFTTGWLGVPTMSFFFNSISIRLLGRTIFGLRLPWVLVGTATVGVVYLLAAQLLGKRMGLATALLLATYHYHIHYSRLGSNQIADPLFLALALLFLYRAIDHKRRFDWAMLGTVTGLAFYFYAGARLTPVIVTAVVGYLFLRSPRDFLRQHWLGMLIGLGAFLVVTAPMIQYAIRFPNDFNARLNEVGIIQSGWLAREVELRGTSKWPILFDQFQRAALAFNYYTDRTVWYGLTQPLLDPFYGALFLLGLLYGTIRLLDREIGHRLAPFVAWWWGGMFAGGMLTESPPSSQRLITLAVPVCFFIAFALKELIQLSGQAFKHRHANSLLVIALAAFSLISLKTYFADYLPQRTYGGPHAELATQLAPTLNELKYNHRFYFLGPPAMYWGFSTIPYLVADAEGDDVVEPITAPLAPDFVADGMGAVFVALPQRRAELETVRQTFPNGRFQEVYSPVNGRFMAILYIIDQDPLRADD